jgi:hypothetical protein
MRGIYRVAAPGHTKAGPAGPASVNSPPPPLRVATALEHFLIRIIGPGRSLNMPCTG